MELFDRWRTLLLRKKKRCKYNFPHSERFPKSVYWQHPEKSWIYIKKWNGTWNQDPVQAMQTDEGKRQMKAMRRLRGK